MDSDKLYEIIGKTTRVYRKGEPVQRKQIGNLEVVELFGYEHTTNAPKADNFEKVDMVFVDVVVDKSQAEKCKDELQRILREYPQPEKLAGGPSYIELSPNCGLEQDGGLRLMALGKVLGLWDVISGKTLGMDDTEAREMAGMGLLNISGYKI
jgi:hypothetical protein